VARGRTAATAAVVAIIVFIVWFAPGEAASTVAHSARSKEPDGRFVAARFLSRVGFEAGAWNKPPGLLPRSRGLVFLPQVPTSDVTEDGPRCLAGSTICTPTARSSSAAARSFCERPTMRSRS